MSPASRFTAPVLITETAALETLCAKLLREEFVTVDTEFIRETTYYPQLCVVQLAGTDDVAVIDVLAPGIDLAALGALLAAPAVVKVFHAARQDVEIFLHLFGAIPTPLFDTQVAAMVAGYGDQVGYEGLVNSLANGTIDKAHRFSDWAARPLSQAQIDYASADVTFLRIIYEKLRQRLQQEGRLEWVGEEMAVLTEPATYQPDPETLWEKLRPRTNSRKMLNLLRAVVAWRDRTARRVNVPRQRIVKDESLLEIAATVPANTEALTRIRGISRGFAEGLGQELIATLETAKAAPESSWPTLAKNDLRPSPALVALLKVLLAAKSEEHQVAAKLLASGDDLDRIALGATADLAPLHGWRRQIFGNDALALVQGKLFLGTDGKKIRLVPAAQH